MGPVLTPKQEQEREQAIKTRCAQVAKENAERNRKEKLEQEVRRVASKAKYDYIELNQIGSGMNYRFLVIVFVILFVGVLIGIDGAIIVLPVGLVIWILLLYYNGSVEERAEKVYKQSYAAETKRNSLSQKKRIGTRRFTEREVDSITRLKKEAERTLNLLRQHRESAKQNQKR
jgi:hypothetical protein